MKKKKRGFFATLFGWRRRRDLTEISVGSVIAKLMESNLARTVSAEEMDLETLLAESASQGPGVLAVFFGSRDIPDLILSAPDRAAAALMPPGTPRAPKASHAALGAYTTSDSTRRTPEGRTAAAVSIPLIVRQASENLADFLAVGESEDEGPRGPIRGAHHKYFKKLTAADAEEFLWKVSGCVAYRLSFASGEDAEDPPRFYALVSEAVAARTRKAFETDKEFGDAVRALLDGKPAAADSAGAAGGAAPFDGTVSIAAPREFVVGNLFLMPRVNCGKYLLESRFTFASLAVDGGKYANAPGIWVLASAEVAAKKWTAWYFFPAPEPGKARPDRGTCKALASCIFREAVRSLSNTLNARAEKPAIALDAKPDLSGKTGLLVFTARIGIGTARYPCEIFFEYSLLSLLLKTFLDPAELSSASRGPTAVLPLLFSLNQSLFRKQLGAFHHAFVGAERGDGFFPFAAMMDLLPDRDCAIVLQNHVLQNMGSKNLRLLFSYSEDARTPDGRRAVRIVTPFAFDEERLLSFLPPNAREDWENAGRGPLCSAEEHRRLSREIMEGIHRAARKKILLVSPRTVFILERMFLPGVRARAREELGRIAADGIPYNTVRKLPKAQIQQYFGLQANRVVCVSLLGSEQEMAFVTANVSRKRAAQLMEDFAFVKRQFQGGFVESGEILSARQEMERSARKLMQDIAKQAAREKTGLRSTR